MRCRTACRTRLASSPFTASADPVDRPLRPADALTVTSSASMAHWSRRSRAITVAHLVWRSRWDASVDFDFDLIMGGLLVRSTIAPTTPSPADGGAAFSPSVPQSWFGPARPRAPRRLAGLAEGGTPLTDSFAHTALLTGELSPFSLSHFRDALHQHHHRNPCHRNRNPVIESRSLAIKVTVFRRLRRSPDPQARLQSGCHSTPNSPRDLGA
jgi:hypothetical protein